MLSALQTAGATRIITLNDGPANEDLIVTATISEGPAGIQANLQKDGAGVSRLVLAPQSGANTFTGTTTVNSGFVNIRTDEALGSDRTNEVQRGTLSTFATGGTWRISFDGQTTPPLTWDATLGDVCAAINALPSIAERGGHVRVANYSSARDFVVTFLGGMAGVNWADDLLSVDASALTPGVTATVVNQVQGGTRSGTVVNSGFTLELEGGVTVIDEPLSLTGVGRPIGPLSYVGQTVTGTGALRATSGENTWLGTTAANLITPAGDTTYNADAGAKLVLAASVNASTRLLYKTGAGEVEIISPVGVNTTYTGTGATYVNEGMLVLNKPANLTSEVQSLSQLGPTDEQQRVAFSVTNPTAGSWSLSFESQATSLLAYNASATNVRDALAALSSVGGAANVDVQGTLAAGFTVTFVNAAGNIDYPNMTVDSNTLNKGTTIAVAGIVNGGTPVASGTYTLNFNGQTTWPLAWNATPAAVQAALEVLPTVGAGNVLVAGTAGADMVFTFRGFLDNADLPAMSAQIYMMPTAAMASVVAGETMKGVGDEIQTVTFSAHPTGGYFALSYNGSLTSPIPYNSTAAAVQAALEAIPAIGAGNVQVMGGPGTPMSPFMVRFTNLLGHADVNALAGLGALAPATTVGVVETAKGGFAALGQSLGSGSVFIGDVTGAEATIRYGADASSNTFADTAAVYVLPTGVLDLATNNKSERVATLWLGVGGRSSAQVATGSGTLALNPTGANVEPGEAASRLTVNAATTLAADSVFTVDLNGTAAGKNYDQIVQNGPIHLNNAVLQLNVGYAPSPSDRFVLIDNRGTGPIDGQFAGLPNHSLVDIAGQQFRVFYDGGDGNDMVLVKAAPLAVTSIRYDAGPNDLGDGAQRSVISRVVVTFNGLVDSMDVAGALRVDRVISWADIQSVNTEYAQHQVGEATQAILTFSGDDIYTYERPASSEQYSLNDGNYRLTVAKDRIHSLSGDMAANEIDDFFRWFGDSDGDRYTSGNDMFVIRRVLAGDTAYDPYRSAFDYNADDVVNSTDFNLFRTRYGRRLLPPT